MAGYFDFFHVTYYTATCFCVSIATAIHILLNRHEDSQSSVMWLMVVFYFPILGVILYLIFGINRIYTRGEQIRLASELIRSEKNSSAHKALSMHYQEQMNYVFSPDGNNYPEFCAMLDRLLPDTIPLRGNSLELLRDGTKAYPRMLEEISKAKSSIHLQSFIIMNDPVGTEVMKALEQKAMEGVEVRILYDKFGSLKAGFLFGLYGKGLKNFQSRAFSPILNFRMPWAIQLRNHRKLLVIDGRIAFTGGINISRNNDMRWSEKDKYIHDLHCIIHGPAVGEFQFSFLRDWFYATSENPAKILREEYFPVLERKGDSVVRVVPSGPGQDFEATEKVFVTAMNAAKKYIWIVTPYFVPDRPFWKMLCATAARGVEIKIIVPRKNNHWYVQFASQNLYQTLLEHGVRIYEKEGDFSHAKAMLVDGNWVYMGSSNCDVRSFMLNYELDFAVFGGSFIDDIHNQLMKEFAESREVFLANVLDRGVVRRIVESASSLLTPIL